MASGRPTTYEDRFCDLLIDHMTKGYSFESFAAITDTCKDTLYEWVKVHPEFSDAKKRATDKSRLFWEKVGIENIVNIETMEKDESGSFTAVKKSLNSAAWIFNMKNRFKDDWKDKHETELSGNVGTVIMPLPIDADLEEND
jgi:hypothetical protein